MKIDPRVFAHPDNPNSESAKKLAVPELLERSQMDIDLVGEYCRQFNLEPDFAYLCYIQKVILTKPNSDTSPSDMMWATLTQRAAGQVEERKFIGCLRKVLTQINGLEYEKINIVCTWLVNALTEDAEEMSNNEEANFSLNPRSCKITKSKNFLILLNIYSWSTKNEYENITFRLFITDHIISKSQSNETDKENVQNFRSNLTGSTLDISCFGLRGGIADEIDNYKRYIDIATGLSKLTFPLDSTKRIPNAETVYEGFYS